MAGGVAEPVSPEALEKIRETDPGLGAYVAGTVKQGRTCKDVEGRLELAAGIMTTMLFAGRFGGPTDVAERDSAIDGALGSLGEGDKALRAWIMARLKAGEAPDALSSRLEKVRAILFAQIAANSPGAPTAG